MWWNHLTSTVSAVFKCVLHYHSLCSKCHAIDHKNIFLLSNRKFETLFMIWMPIKRIYEENVVHIYTMKYCLLLNMRQNSVTCEIWMKLEAVLLSEISQEEKDKYCVIWLWTTRSREKNSVNHGLLQPGWGCAN